ncbi:ABC transporter ATP-binding protein [Streptomyces sp. NPDC059255]|uniref:ABC transporter ATP-binding protein n=1 Tax=Streptomyces sp. NPDC059255 TaxID=3346793 RepID=UPI0036939057
MTASVAVHGLTVRHRKKVALDAVHLGFGKGVHGLLGPNGAGKTSLIRVLATVAAPAGGRVELLGRDVAEHRGRAEVRRRLGYLPQQFGYYPGFTVREFVAYVAWLKEMDAAGVPAAVERAVERVGLADRIDAKVKTLSGGMVRRVGIAQALVNEPELLLLDEPTAGLDPEQRVEFRALLREVGTTATVIVSTHLVEDVAAACSEVTLLEAGRVAFRGTTADLTALGENTGEDRREACGAGGGVSIGARAGAGDHPIERGYTAALRSHRTGAARGRAGTTAATPATATAGSEGAE